MTDRDDELDEIAPEDIPNDAIVIQGDEVVVDGEIIGQVDPEEYRPSTEDLQGGGQ